MGSASAVGIHDDLAAGKAGVAVRASDDEFAGGVDMKYELVVKKGCDFRTHGLFQARDEDVLHVLADAALHSFFLVELVMLGRKNEGVHAHCLAFGAVFDGELALGVRAEVRHRARILAADVGQDHQRLVGEGKRQRHVIGSLVAGIAEHYALVAGALLEDVGLVDSLRDVGALLVDG